MKISKLLKHLIEFQIIPKQEEYLMSAFISKIINLYNKWNNLEKHL